MAFFRRAVAVLYRTSRRIMREDIGIQAPSSIRILRACKVIIQSPSATHYAASIVCSLILLAVASSSALAATVTNVSSPTANGSYKAGAQLSITVTFSERVNVTGTPTLTLATGGAGSAVSYSSGSGTSSLTFLYTVAAGHNSTRLDYLNTGALGLNGGTIRNVSDGNAAILTLPTPGAAGSLSANKNLVIDTTAPTATLALLTTSPTNSLPIRVSITFSEAVTGLTNSGLTVTNGTVSSITGSGTSYTANISATANGNVTIQLGAGAAVDGAGNSNTASSTVTVVYDTVRPVVTNVTSSPSTGAFRATQIVNVIVTFSKAVTVAGGTPTLALATGATPATATYLSGSGTTQLTFKYTINAGDTSEDLEYTSTNALSLNGATIRDSATNDAVLTLPTPGAVNSLSANSSVIIDTTLPSVVITSSISGSTPLDAIPVTVVFSEAVTGFSLTGFSVSNGCASNLRGSGTTYYADIVPRTNGTVTVSVAANAALDRSGNGNTAAPTPVSVIFSTFAPRVTTVTSLTPDGAYRATQQVSIQVSFSEAVIVSGTPQLKLATGNVATVNYQSGSGTSTLTFLYTIASGENSADLDYIPLPSLFLNGGRIVDAATQSYDISRTFACPGAVGSLSASKNIVVDTIAPTIARVTSTTANGSYRAGQMINIQSQFSETVYVTGIPQLTLATGPSAAVVFMTGGSRSATLSFLYAIRNGDNSSRLDYQSTSAFGLNGAVITDLAGNVANVTLPATGSSNSLFGQKQLVVDTTPPTISNVTSTTANGSFKAGTIINLQVALSEVVYVTGAPRIQLATGLPSSYATYASGSGTSTLNFSYTVVSGDNTSRLDYASTTALELNGGTIRDLAGNNTTLALAPPGAQFSLSYNKEIKLDTTSPKVISVSSSSSNGMYNFGTVVSIRINFSEPVSVMGKSYLLLNTSPSQGSAWYSGGSGTSSLTYDYWVSDGENSVHLDYSSQSSLVIYEGFIRDAATNGALLTLPTPGSPGSLGASSVIIIDTQPPSVTQVWSSTPSGRYKAGSSIDIYVSFSEVINLIGSATLTLATDPIKRSATCNSLFNPSTLHCTYTVQPGDDSNDLDYDSIKALSMNDDSSNVTDPVGNIAEYELPTPGSLGSISFSSDIVLDTTAPTVILSSSAPNDTNTSPIPVTITLSEPVSGLSLGAFSVSNGTIQNLTGSGTSYTAELVPAAQGSLSVTLAAGSATDVAGNGNSASNTLTRNYDSIRPTVVIATTLASQSNATSIPATITFSETVSGFDVSDIQVTNGSIDSFSGSGTTYSISITPTSDGAISIAIAENVAVDIAQNGNETAQTLNLSIDRTSPTITSVTTSLPDGAYSTGTQFTIDIVFSEPVQLSGSYSLALATQNGASTALCSLISAPNTLRCSYTVAAGDTSADLDYVAASSLAAATQTATLTDLVGNVALLTLPTPGQTGSISFSQNIVLDTTAPTVTLSSSAPANTNTSPIPLAITFSEPISGLSLGAFSVSNGTIRNLTGSGTSYIAELVPAAQGSLSVTLPAASATDVAGNGNSASNTLTRNYDSILPTVTIDGISSQTLNTRTIPLTIEFSEPVTGFTADDIAVSHGLVSSLSGSGTSYQVEILATDDGQVAVSIPANVAFDSAGNGNIESGSLTKTVDSIPARVISVTSSTSDGYYRAGSVITIQVKLSEPVIITGAPALALQTGRSGVSATYKSGDGTDTITFEYVVTDGDNSLDLDYPSELSLTTGEGAITDLALNSLNSSLPTPGTAQSLSGNKNLVIDTTPPSQPAITSPQGGQTIHSRSVSVRGTADANMGIVLVDSQNRTLCTTHADEGGSWGCELTNLSHGRYTIQARAEDLALNTASSTSTQFSISAITPEAPVFTQPTASVTTDSTPLFGGTAPIGTIVHVILDGLELCSAVVDPQGNWSCESTSTISQGRFNIQGIAEDLDISAMSAPTALALTVGSQFTGKVLMANRSRDPLPEVTISDGVNVSRTDSDGAYSFVTISAQSGDITASKQGWKITRSSATDSQFSSSDSSTVWLAVPVLDKETYTVWNNSLEGFNNSIRILNKSSSSQTATVTLYQADGSECPQPLTAAIAPLDYTLVDLSQSSCFTSNSHGLAKIALPSNEYDGQLVVQRSSDKGKNLTSTYALPIKNSVKGRSAVFVDNTYHMTSKTTEKSPWGNELVISNLSSTEKRYTVNRYRSNSMISKSDTVTVPAKGSRSVTFPKDGEEEQENGIFEIEPEDATQPYIAVLTRKGEQQLKPSTNTGVLLLMQYSEQGISRNLFSRVRHLNGRYAVQYAEIANVATVGTVVSIKRVDSKGRTRPTINLHLRPKQTRKIRLSKLLRRYQEGVADISSSTPDAIMVNSITKHYRGDKKLLSMKSNSIEEVFGDDLFGSYQRPRGTKTLLKLTNMGSETVQGSAACYENSQAVEVRPFTLKPGTLDELILEECFHGTTQGVIQVNASSPGVVVADTLTFRRNEDIHVPARLR